MGDTVIPGGEERVGESVALLNKTTENETMPLSHQFIYSVYAQGTSGVFVWTALILTCFQVLYPTRRVLQRT